MASLRTVFPCNISTTRRGLTEATDATIPQLTQNTDSSQAVRAAIRANDLPLLRILLDEWRHDPHPVPRHGPERQPMLPFQASLQEAARNGQPDVVDALISQGCQIDTGK